NALARQGCDRRVVTLICQVRIDADDPALGAPSKFVGRGLTEASAAALRASGARVEADGRGNLRRLVPSPQPVEVVESHMVAELVEEGAIVIAAGGGGIPVYRDERLGLEGVDAVVDKDRAAAILARDIGAEQLLILTDVDGVYEGWGSDEARRIERLTLAEAHRLLEDPESELGTGSMRPKVEAAADFVASGGRRAVIAKLEEGTAAIEGRAGTEVVAE
ncbi:MAG: carbamate kinase, partial [Gemmatimonadota bacterium]